MIPIGRGQRQLIIGDRQTGKTAIAIDTILNQKDNWASGDPNKRVRCIYVGCWPEGIPPLQLSATPLRLAARLEYTTIVASPASDAAGFRTWHPTPVRLSASTGCTVASTLIIFDDLSKQAKHTALCPCCCAARRDVKHTPVTSYLHSRLLERCAKLSDDLGAGSMTGFPIVRPRQTTFPPSFRPTSSPLLTARSSCESDLFQRITSVRQSTSVSPSPVLVVPHRPGYEEGLPVP